MTDESVVTIPPDPTRFGRQGRGAGLAAIIADLERAEKQLAAQVASVRKAIEELKALQ